MAADQHEGEGSSYQEAGEDRPENADAPRGEYEEAWKPELDPPFVTTNSAVWRPQKKERTPLARHTADTRRFLAWAIVGSTLVLYGYLTVAMVCGWTGSDTYAGAIQTLAPLQSLAAATVGFFFGRQKGDK